MRYHLFVLNTFLAVGMLSQCLVGCSSSSNTSRGPLSDAMSKASDDNKGPRTVTTPSNDSTSSDASTIVSILKFLTVDTTASIRLNRDSSLSLTIMRSALTPTGGDRYFFGLGVGTGVFSAGAASGYGDMTVIIGKELDEHSDCIISIGAGYVAVPAQSKLRASIKNGLDAGAVGVQIRYYPTRSIAATNPYIILGGSLSFLGWSYANPIQSGDSTIERDDLFGFQLDLGAGMSIYEGEKVGIALEALPGAIFWGNKTGNGFDNDVFGTSLFCKFRVVIEFYAFGR